MHNDRDAGTRTFFDVVDRLGVPRQQPRRVEAALRLRLASMSAGELEDFQHGFDVAIADLRTPALWSAASLVHEPLDPHDYDGFAAWLLFQGRHVALRARSDPDAVITALTRTLFGRRRRPRYDDVLDVAQRIYAERFDRDLYVQVAPPPARDLAPLLDGEPESGQRWTHPEILRDRYPRLWNAYATRALRVLPLTDIDDDICNCCGRVHRRGFGLLAHKGRPLGSYTLHWVEGSMGRVDSTIALDEGDRHVMFAVRHSQFESRSGLDVLERDEAPLDPANATLLGRSEARAHPLYRRAMKCALEIWQRDPRIAEVARAWTRRQLLAPICAKRIAVPAQPGDRACGSCGRVHANMEISHNFPDCLGTMSRWQWRHRVQDDDRDELLLDGRRRFVRGLLPVPVAGANDPYRFGVWVERLDPARGTRDIDGNDTERRLQRGACGLIANDLLFQRKSTLGLEVGVRQRGDELRPEFMLDDNVDHPLATLQRKGMPSDMPRRLLTLVPHD
ncbi:MAG: DUF2199 domain-containing protein [Dokdonella sp.]